jgi:hypothetical protein
LVPGVTAALELIGNIGSKTKAKKIDAQNFLISEDYAL